MINPTKTTQKLSLDNAAHLAEIRRRLGDYSASNLIEERDKLVAAWRDAHPESAKEPASLKHHVLDKSQHGVIDDANRPEIWFNDIYQVTVRRWSKDKVFGSTGGMVQIGINALNGTARHDWREFQMIKNQVAGPECEAFELYPAESRLLDPSNYYTLWCFPGVKRLNIGVVEKRRVLDVDEALAPQRAFEK
jgi:hypothetical protein